MKNPDVSRIMDAIYELEDGKEQQAKARAEEAAKNVIDSAGYLSSGLKSEGQDDEELGSNVSTPG